MKVAKKPGGCDARQKLVVSKNLQVEYGLTVDKSQVSFLIRRYGLAPGVAKLVAALAFQTGAAR